MFANELHYQDIGLNKHGNWAINGTLLYSFQVSNLFLSPLLDHLPWIALFVTLAESKFALHVLISILEDQNGGFVDFDCKLLLCFCILSVVDVCLLSSRNASIY